ncbi:unnamed protein product [Linum trigynum]|uniref:Uncharacterized protein n=1 Tax=Linum trigynum TaxID=586398 RepID=A0AAV2CHB4_9ROSI
MYLVVRYLHVPMMCKQCKEFGHCEGEGKECKEVQVITDKELIRAEDMTDEVAWVSKAKANLSGRSNEGEPVPVVGSISGGSAVATLSTEGGPVPVVGSTEGGPVHVTRSLVGGPVPVAGSPIVGGPVPVAGSSSGGTTTPLNTLSGKLIDEDGFQPVTRKGKGIAYYTTLKVFPSTTLNAQGHALVIRGPPKKGRGKKHK